MRARPLLCVPLAALVTWTSAANADDDERILSLHADVEIEANGDLLVTERIQVRSAGRRIKHGISRQLPARQSDGLFVRIVGYRVDGAACNGHPVPMSVEHDPESVRIDLGDDVALPPGEHTYELRYAVEGQVRFFPGHDELSWNVTGHEWAFPIDRASAAVRVPPAAEKRIKGADAHVGVPGARDPAYQVRIESDRIRVETTRALGIGEGLTVVAVLPKGAVVEPTTEQQWLRRMRDNCGLLISWLAPLVVLAYFRLVARRVGARPALPDPGPVTKPPAGLSPAALRLLVEGRGDLRAFASALLRLASQGAVRIHEDAAGLSIEKRVIPDSLTREEVALMAPLFTAGDRVDLRRRNADVRAALSAFEGALAPHRKPWFVRRVHLTSGCLLAALFVPACGAQPDVIGGLVGAFQVLAPLPYAAANALGFGVVAPTLAAAAARIVSEPLRLFTWGQVLGALFVLAFLLGPVFFVAFMFGLRLAVIAAGLIVASFVCGWFVLQWRPRSPLGWRLVGEVEAYRRHLGSRARFSEAELPYLLALDLDLDDERRKLTPAGPRALDVAPPSWYLGRRFQSPRAFTSFCASFTAALSVATSARSSSISI